MLAYPSAKGVMTREEHAVPELAVAFGIVAAVLVVTALASGLIERSPISWARRAKRAFQSCSTSVFAPVREPRGGRAPPPRRQTVRSYAVFSQANNSSSRSADELTSTSL